MDYRRLNKLGVKDASAYPLPLISELMDQLKGSVVFSAYDLREAYWSVELDEESKPKSAFVSPPPNAGLWEWQIMPFGLTDAPATFQRLIEVVLLGMTWRGCLAYLDDICLHHSNLEDHYRATEELFDRIEAAGLTFKATKCQVLQKELKYLGHIISAEGVRIDPKQTEAVRNFPRPTSVKEVQSFLGLTNYYRKFIIGYSHVARPMFDLLKKDPPEWGEPQQKAFDALKEALVTPPVLAYPDFKSPPEEAPFILYTDASGHGVGAVLSQKQGGVERVIAYLSRALNKHEQNYAVSQREMLAVVWSITKLRHYLWGRPFTVVTDASSLTYLRGVKDPTGRLARWSLALQESSFDVVHRKGVNHKNADALSRVMWNKPLVERTSVSLPAVQLSAIAVSDPYPTGHDLLASESSLDGVDTDLVDPASLKNFLSNLHERQREDSWTSAIMNQLEGRATERDTQITKHLDLSPFTVEKGVLRHTATRTHGYTKPTSVSTVVVPAVLRNQVLYTLHHGWGGGHQGRDKMTHALQQRFYWPGMTREAKAWVDSCPDCAQNRDRHQAKTGTMGHIVADRPFQIVGVDVVGPFPTSSRQKKYVLTIVDIKTRWVEAFAVKNKSAATVAKILVDHIIPTYGAPETLLSDRGGEFMNDLIKGMCELFAIRKIFTTAYHPRCNGHTEVVNRTLKLALRAYASKYPRSWDQYLPSVLLAYRSAVHSTTKFSPYYLLFGRHMRLPIDATLTAELGLEDRDLVEGRRDEVQEAQRAVKEAQQQMERAGKMAEENDELKRARSATVFNRGRKEVKYHPGDHVRVWMPPIRAVGTPRALDPLWDEGPWEVLEQVGPSLYKLRDTTSRRGTEARRVHTDRMQPILPSAVLDLQPRTPVEGDVQEDQRSNRPDNSTGDAVRPGEREKTIKRKREEVAAHIPSRTRAKKPHVVAGLAEASFELAEGGEVDEQNQPEQTQPVLRFSYSSWKPTWRK